MGFFLVSHHGGQSHGQNLMQFEFIIEIDRWEHIKSRDIPLSLIYLNKIAKSLYHVKGEEYCGLFKTV
jgi:hypothetical protein